MNPAFIIYMIAHISPGGAIISRVSLHAFNLDYTGSRSYRTIESERMMQKG